MALWYSTEQEAIDAAVAIANETKDDNCTPPTGITVTPSDDPTYDGCQVTIHLIVADACGNLTEVDYTTTIDTENPTADITPIDDCYEVSENTQNIYENAINAAIAATIGNDDCTDPEDLVYTTAVTGSHCALNIAVTITDNCGKSTTVTYTTRVDSQAPIITSEPDAISVQNGFCFETEEEAENAAILATIAGDDCGGDLQYDAFTTQGCPAEILVVVTDLCGNSSDITYTDVYIDDETPTLSAPNITACFQSVAAAYAELIEVVTATDNCTSEAALQASAVGTFTLEPGEDNCYNGTVTLTYTDVCGHTASIDFPNITIDDVDPVLVSLPQVDNVYTCVDEVPQPDVEGVLASDDCSEFVSVTWISDDTLATCPHNITRVYRLTDGCGNFIDVTQVINVVDDVRPTWVTEPGDLDLTYLCDNEQVIDAVLEGDDPVAEDNCGEVTLVKTTGSFVPSQTCPQEGTYTNTWTATDACGNAAETVFTQTITVVDNEWPLVDFGCQYMPALLLTTSDTADCPAEADISLEVGQSVNVLQNWFVAGKKIQNLVGCISDNCSPLDQIKVTLVEVAYDENENYPQGCSKLITASFLISDACGNINPDTFVCQYLIIDNTAPVWITQDSLPFPNGIDGAISCSDQDALAFLNGLTPSASDNCPGDVTIEKTPGQFVPGQDCPSEGTITNTFVAYDACGENNPSVVFTQVITLFDNEPPTFDPECQLDVDLLTSEGADCPGEAGITLIEGQILEYNQGWEVAGIEIEGLANCIDDNCSDASLIKIHVVSIEDSYDTESCSRSITVSFQLEDACGNLQEDPFVCVYHIIDDEKPNVFCNINLGGPSLPQSCYATVAAAEADALEAVSPCDDCTSAEDLVLTVSTVGTCDAAVTVTVTDCAGNTDAYTFHTRIDNITPALTTGQLGLCYTSQTLAEAAAIAATTVTDNCDLYAEMLITASTEGTCPAVITVTATDDCGNSNSVVYQNVCISTGSVVITTEASNQSADCSQEANALGAWLANHGGAIASGNNISWTNTTPVFTANCNAHNKSATVTFTATDNCGYTDQTTATFTVIDNTAPTANLIAGSQMSCNVNVPAPNLALVTGVSDNCDASPTIALFSNTSNNGTGCPGNPIIIVRTYSVTDDYCNTTYVTHTITIVDNVPPTFTAPGNITINVNAACAYDASPAVTGDATNEQDNCSSGLNATYTDAIAPGVESQVKFKITRTWRLVDNCGNSATPLTQIITVLDVTPPSLVGCPQNISLIGGPIENTCGAYAGQLTLPFFNDNCDGESISYQLSGITMGGGNGYVPALQVFKEGQTTVVYTATDAVGNTTTCSFIVTVDCITISGRLIWEHDDATGVKDATVRLTPTMPPVSTLSLTNGNYSLTAPASGTYTITPVKNIFRLNGVDMADVVVIQQHLSGNPLITDPYKKVAADVNRTGFITTQDPTLILQCLAGNPNALSVFNVFWRFVPTTFAMPATPANTVPAFPENIMVTVSGPDVTGKDFFGMKLGDVNGSANPALAPQGSPLVWMLKDQELKADTEIELNFAASNFKDLAALQFALDFDPSYLQFTGFKSMDAIGLTQDNFGDFQANLGELRVVWSQATGVTLADGTPVLKAKFKVLRGGQKLSEVLQLDEDLMPCKAYTPALVSSDVRVVFEDVALAISDPANIGKPQLQLFQNNPNPFAGQTTIGFVLPDACDAQLRVMDVSGRELTHYKRSYSAGYHEIEFRMENAASYGVLYYELITPFGNLTKKMVTTGK